MYIVVATLGKELGGPFAANLRNTNWDGCIAINIQKHKKLIINLSPARCYFYTFYLT